MKKENGDKTRINQRSGSLALRETFKAVLLMTGAACLAGAAHAADGDDSSGGGLKLSGYVRAWASYNLEDQDDTPGYNDRGKLSMLRGSVAVAADMATGPVKWHGVLRADQETLTAYQRELQDRVRATMPGGPGSNIMDEYKQAEIRELYADFDVNDRVHLRLGKQQVVWGETDLFHPTDLIHGFDYRWRFFLEGEPDELRKPLIMANATIKVPEADGALQVVVRPGWDRKKDIANSYAFSGRWAQETGKAQDFLAGPLQYDYKHPSGEYDAMTGGMRWTGLAGSVNYALSALRTFSPDPVVNPAGNPYLKTPAGGAGDLFYPLINVYSASVSGEIPALDTVGNVEVAFHNGRKFNSGLASTGFAGPVLSKNVLQTTFRFDKTLRLMDWLGTSNPSLSSLQIFDTAVLGLNSSDEIVNAVGHPLPLRKHTTVASYFFSLPYMAGKLEYSFVLARYLQSGDTLFMPSVKYNYGNNWRFVAEANIFKARQGPEFENLGGFNKSDQLMFRATYQF